MKACQHIFKTKTDLFHIEQRFIKALISGHMCNSLPTTCSFTKTMMLYFSNLLLIFLLAFCSHLCVYYLFGASIPAFQVPLVTNLY